MATYLFSNLAGGSTIAFDPDVDVLNFDNTSLSASEVRFDYAADGTAISFAALAKKIFLPPAVSITRLSSDHVVFANGSLLIVGNNSPANDDDDGANTLSGSMFGDQLVGWSGADLLLGSLGNDRLNGGLGADTMKGGPGADTYVVDDAGDVVSEEPLLVSSDAAGTKGSGSRASFSADGRYVVFESDAGNLVSGDTNYARDIFVKDLQSGAIRRVSTDASGAQANNYSYDASFSADVRYVVFESYASNLVPGDTNGNHDIFVKDLQTGSIQRVSTGSGDAQADLGSYDASFSADGRYVVFQSYTSNLVSGDDGGRSDIFVKDLQTGSIQRVSTAASGVQGNYDSYNASFSPNGRYVVFDSYASNLVADDTNNRTDIFVKDLQTGAVERVSTDAAGAQANGPSRNASFSADGRYVVFESDASNLAAGDNHYYVDIFVKDLQTGAIQCVSNDSQTSDLNKLNGSLSADGRYVVFTGYDSHPYYPDFGQNEGYETKSNVFIKDLQTGALQSLFPDYGYLRSWDQPQPPKASFSTDGHFLLVDTDLDQMVDGDNSGDGDVFMFGNPFVDPDVVQSSVSFTLPDRVENLILTGGDNINGTGNALDNTLIGNDGNNMLDGGGGADTMGGGMGSDTYVVNHVGDVVEETSSFKLLPIRVLSTDLTGTQGNSSSEKASFSADGRYLVFESYASNLVTGDTNHKSDIFVRDLYSGVVQRVSMDSTGAQANGYSDGASFSADGRYVVFESDASNLVVDDSNGYTDIFVKDLQTGAIQRVSTDSTGAQANGYSYDASFSADGRYVVFESNASNLVTGDTNNQRDIFVKDLQTGAILRVSTSVAGAQADFASHNASFSADGRYVLFESDAGNLVEDDRYGYTDIFVKDLQTGAIQRVSTDSTGAQLYSGNHINASFSTDGRHVVFTQYDAYDDPGDPWNMIPYQYTDTNIFIKDIETGALERLFSQDAHVDWLENSSRASFSVDGRYLVFATYANDLVDGDQDNDWDIFVKDLQTGAVRRVAADSTEQPVWGHQVEFSPDGLYVVFDSYASNLVEGGTNDRQIFVAPNPFVIVGGTDTVRSSLSYTLTANVENLLLTGGKYDHINATGNALANALTGNDGNNVLDGGAGDDTLTGGAGNDSYYVDTPVDRVLESSAGGMDTVFASCSFTLSANVENLTLTGNADLDGTGSTLDNLLIGNSAANVLDGGSGHDTLSGGDGADLLLGGEGNDSVGGGAGADRLLGGAGNDTLDGGMGVDTMDGGPGNDLYIVDDGADVVSESLTSDPVLVSVSASGSQGNGYYGSSDASFSTSGRYVLFQSYADNLIPDDGNRAWDIFVKDLQSGSIECISTNATGAQANYSSSNAAFSNEGRYLVFESDATNLVTGDTNSRRDIFVKDVQTGAILRVSTDAVGAQGNQSSSNASFSVDGRYVVFESQASNLVLNDGNGVTDLFVKDLQSGEIRNISIDAAGVQGDRGSGAGSFSADGRYVVFQSDARNLVALDGNDATDIFLKDLQTDDLQLVSSDALGTPGNGSSTNASIAADGNRIVFESVASNLVAGDSNDSSDIFVKDLQSGAIERVSTGSDGTHGNGSSSSASLSADGRYLVFASLASNLVANDTNASSDIFVKDLVSGTLLRLSTNVGGSEGNAGSFGPRFSADGRSIIFSSDADNLVANDNNRQMDVIRVINPFVETGGADTIRSSVSYVLPDRIEKLILTGSAQINATGNAQDNTLTGNGSDNVLDGGAGADTLSGGAGNDRYVVDNADDSVIEFLGNGTDTVFASISYRLGGYVEDLTLTGTAGLAGTGNALNNTLTGNDGDNLLDGGSGADTMAGGWGDDTYVVDSAGDVVNEAVSSGNDTVQSTVSFSLAALINVENVTLLGLSDLAATGNAGDNILAGNAGDNVLDGGEGSDTVSYCNAGAAVEVSLVAGEFQRTGFGDDTLVSIENLTGSRYDDTLIGNDENNVLDGGQGFDLLIGLGGDDSYVVDSAGDRVIEAADDGIDAVFSAVSLILADNVEQLTLTGSANLVGYGNALNNLLIGNAGRNLLDGGAGNDTMLGGDGNDYYYVRDSGDSVSETNATASTGGTDLVYSYLSSYTLGANVENGRIVASVAANLSGNSLDNYLYAGAGNNVINGGAGSDTVSYYYGVSGTTGVIVSLATTAAQATGGSGTDTLAAIEHLRGSNNADKLTGNSGGNRLEGYAGNDTLDGGTGNDTMLGGDGNDYYYVRDSGDIVSETNPTASTGGTDTVLSYLSSYTLGANVENGRIVSSAAAKLSGNSLNNFLYAGAGDNVINGSAGSDTVSYYYGVSGSTGVTVSLATTAAQATGGSGTDTLTAIEHLRGSNNADKLTGNSGANRLEGYAGNDTLDGGTGNDTLDGGTGNDTMLGGDGNDYYYVRDSGDIVSESSATASTGGTDTVLSYVSSYTLGANLENGRIVTSAAANLSGNSLNNYLYAGAGDNVIDGGAGSDTVSYYYGVSGTTGVIVSLATTAAQATGGSGTDTLTSIEHLRGSNNAEPAHRQQRRQPPRRLRRQRHAQRRPGQRHPDWWRGQRQHPLRHPAQRAEQPRHDQRLRRRRRQHRTRERHLHVAEQHRHPGRRVVPFGRRRQCR
jgi:Tol biopolymer transport system component